MSNGRKPGRSNTYRTGYLRSTAWFARRDEWFHTESRRAGELRCAGCRVRDVKSRLELHHIDYARVAFREGRWIAGETHADLICLHPRCHELLHRLIDRDRILRYHRTRTAATAHALNALHTALRSHTHA